MSYETDDIRQIIDILAAERKRRGISQTNIRGLGQGAVSEIENGKTTPKLASIITYAEALAAKLVFRLEFDEMEKKP